MKAADPNQGPVSVKDEGQWEPLSAGTWLCSSLKDRTFILRF